MNAFFLAIVVLEDKYSKYICEDKDFLNIYNSMKEAMQA